MNKIKYMNNNIIYIFNYNKNIILFQSAPLKKRKLLKYNKKDNDFLNFLLIFEFLFFRF